MSAAHEHSARRGFTRSELVVTLAAVILLVTVALPSLGAGRSRSREMASLSNLQTLAAAHTAYAKDWDDRQFSLMPEGMSAAGGQYGNYYNMFQICPPSIVLGYGGSYPVGQGEGEWAYWMPCSSGVGLSGNFPLLWPLQFGTVGGGSIGYGMWQLQNVKGFNEYVNGRFMDPVFYAPADAAAMSTAGPGLESPNPFTYIPAADGGLSLSSYVSSPAAMFNPGVFGGDDGSYKSPYTFVQASFSPTVSQCAHPDLKTRFIEYRWCQSPPMIPPFTASPEIAFFNLGADSEPMTLFFDGHTAGLPVRKVLADNAAVVKGGGSKLWMDTEITVGPWAGYEGFYSFLSIDDTRTSFHVFTRDGILGRDCVTAP